jgi:hypothetical protein
MPAAEARAFYNGLFGEWPPRKTFRAYTPGRR